MTEGVSVVVCCFNSASRIKETLECLQAQQSGKVPWEVIVVDNMSTDDTMKIVEEIWNANPVTTLRTFQEQERGQTYARKRGLDNASFEFVSFVDDDNRVDPNWVSSVYDTLHSHPDVAACNGISTASFEADEPWWFQEFATNFAVGTQGMVSGYVPNDRGFLFGAGLSVRKTALVSLYDMNYPAIQSGRLIDELRGGGEDSELCFCFLLCGYRLYYDERIRFSHYMPASRMNENGLRRIQTSLGRDEVVLSIYRSLINPLIKPKNKWWLEYFAYLKYYLRFILKNLWSTGKQRFLFRTRMVYHRAYLGELIHLRKHYDSYRERINEFARNCKRKKEIIQAT